MTEIPVRRRPPRITWAPMKINMLLHFYAVAEPYHNRDNTAYDLFLAELIDAGLVRERTTGERVVDRHEVAWTHVTTEAGNSVVTMLCDMVPLMVLTNQQSSLHLGKRHEY